MFDTIHKRQRVLVASVSILAILAFIVYFHVYTNSIDFGIKKAVSIYGHSVTQEEVDHLANNYPLAVMLGLYEFLEALGGGTTALDIFVLNQLVIRHEAQVLAVTVTDQQVAQAISQCPLFQRDGKFHVTQYREFVQKQLIARGMNESLLENLFRSALQVARIRKIVSGSVSISDQEILNAFRAYQKADLQVINFDLSQYAAQVHVSLDQMQKLYTKESKNFNTPEIRAARYVVFEIPKDRQLLKGKARIDALQVVADQATAFIDSLANSGGEGDRFETAAKQAGIPMNVLPPFDRLNSNGIIEIKKLQKELPGLLHIVFQLPEDYPYSSAIEGIGKDRFYIFELLSIQPSRPLLFEEVQPQLRDILRNRAAAKLLYEEGREVVASIAKQLQDGKSFKAATTKLRIKSKEVLGVTPFSNLSPEDALYAETALLLSPGQISSIQRSSNGGAYAVFLTRREAIQPVEFAKKKMRLKAQLLKARQTLLFSEWMRVSRKEANVCIKS